MSKYGNKFTCWSCGTKFYDLGKASPKCPKCGADPAADPNVGGGGLPDDADFEGDLDEDLEGADFSDDEESEDLEDAEESETEDEDF